VNLEGYLRSAGVPKRFLGCSFSTYVGRKEPFAPLTDFPENLSFVFFSGNVGAGKTHAAVALLRDAATRDERKGRFVQATALFLELRASFGQAGFSEEQVFGKYLANSVLVIDDLGAEKVSDYVRASWYHIIEARYAEMRPTVVTSNLSLAEISAAYGDRIASRIASGFVLNFRGEDWRLRLREQGAERREPSTTYRTSFDRTTHYTGRQISPRTAVTAFSRFPTRRRT